MPLGYPFAVKELRLEAIKAATILENLHKTQDIPWHLGPRQCARALRTAIARFTRFGP